MAGLIGLAALCPAVTGSVGAKIRNLRIASVVEATSYLLLLIAWVVKQTGGTELGVSLLGPIHGVLYLIFAGLVLVARESLGWPWIRAIYAIVVGSIPFGGFWLHQKWLAPIDEPSRS